METQPFDLNERIASLERKIYNIEHTYEQLTKLLESIITQIQELEAKTIQNNCNCK